MTEILYLATVIYFNRIALKEDRYFTLKTWKYFCCRIVSFPMATVILKRGSDCRLTTREAHSSSAGHEILSILKNPKFHHSVHKSPSLVHVPNQMNPVHFLPSTLKKLKTKLRGRSPQANYTDRATAACRRS
jgi:hypothetical protein